MTPGRRLERALRDDPSPAKLLALATSLRDEGLSGEDLRALYDDFRARHENDGDEARHDALLDTLDHIVGWCRRDQALFPEDQ